MTREPVAITVALVTAVSNVLGVLVLLGAVTLSPEQIAGIGLAVSSVAGLIGALFARAKVSPVSDLLDGGH